MIVRSDDADVIDELFVEGNNVRVSAQPVYIGYPDLTVTNINVPPVVDRGDLLPVQWTVYNRDYAPAGGDWVDYVYLSTDSTFDPGTDSFVGSVERNGGLDARLTYQASLDVDTGALAGDAYYVIVVSDRDDAIFEDSREANNVRVSGESFRLGVPELTMDVPLDDTFDFTGQSKYYQVSVAAGQHLFVVLDDANDLGYNELYIKYGSAPTRSDYEAKYSTNMSADQAVDIATTKAGTYYVLAYADSASDAPAAFSVTASLLDFELFGASPNYGGNAGQATTRFRGAGFSNDLTIELIPPAGSPVAATSQYYVDDTDVWATFDLTGVAPGTYDIKLTQPGGAFALLEDSFFVQPAGGADLGLDLIAPSAVRPSRVDMMTIQVENRGLNDSLAPTVVLVLPPGMTAGLTPDDITHAGEMVIDMSRPDIPVDLLLPGMMSSVPIYFTVTTTNIELPVVAEMYLEAVEGDPVKRIVKRVQVVQAFDPNDKIGPSGFGEANYITPEIEMPYAIYYENDPDHGATAAAQVVQIEDQLDVDLDWSSFELGDINLYGDFWVDVPEGVQLLRVAR